MNYTCSRCRSTLEQLEMFGANTTVVGSIPTYYNGVVCDRCGKIECAKCRNTRVRHSDDPCTWCGASVSPVCERAGRSTAAGATSSQQSYRRYEPPTPEEKRAARAKAEQAAAVKRAGEVSEDISLLTDPDPKIRRAAADRLGEAAEAKAFSPLLQLLAEDSEPSCRAVAAWALGKLGNQSALNALTRSAREDSSDQVRHEASAALNKLTRSEEKWWQLWK